MYDEREAVVEAIRAAGPQSGWRRFLQRIPVLIYRDEMILMTKPTVYDLLPEDELLAQLAEECTETAKAALKLRRANELKHTGTVMEPKNMADALIALCVHRNQSDEECSGCPFAVKDGNGTSTLCGIYIPSGWNMPEEG